MDKKNTKTTAGSEEEYMGVNRLKDISKNFHESIQQILELDIPKVDLIHQCPVYN